MSRIPLRVRITLLTVAAAAAGTILLALSGGFDQIDESVAIGSLESSAEALAKTDDQLADYVTELKGRMEDRDDGPFDDWGDHPGLNRAVLDDGGSKVTFEPDGPVTLTETMQCRASPTVVACESDTISDQPRLPDWAAQLVSLRADEANEVPIVVHGFVATDEAGGSTLIRLETDIFAASENDLTTGTGNLVILILPFLLLGLGMLTWFLIGRVFSPVDAMRAQVDRIGAGSLDQRVPVPEANDELRQLAETMNQMLDRLQQANESQRRFISDASHELRSPIAATGATLELANANPSRTDWPEVAAVIEEENARLARLVDDLLLLAAMDENAQSGRQRSWSTVDLDEICLTEAERSHPVDVTVHVASPARVTGYLPGLTRAVRNLVDNAAAHAVSAVRVEVATDGPEAVVRVIDDGAGIDPEFTERIFERFFRIDESRARTGEGGGGGGAGLGLAIARQVADRHDGMLTVVDSTGPGAAFELRLPSFDTGGGESDHTPGDSAD